VLTCDEFVELVTAYLEAALGPDTQRRFVAHLTAFDGCDRYLGQIRATMDALAELPADSLRGEVRDRLLTAFRERRG
jgi:anti-sigma factor RsiW